MARKKPQENSRKDETWDPAEQIAKAYQQAVRYRSRGVEKPLPLTWERHRRVVVNNGEVVFGKNVKHQLTDWMMAVIASAHAHEFYVKVPSEAAAREYLEYVEEQAPLAAARYRAAYIANWKRVKHTRKEGYLHDTPPTPQLRHIYDSAVRLMEDWSDQNRDFEKSGKIGSGEWPVEWREVRRSASAELKPNGRGFFDLEYHWRNWPLDNLVLITSDGQWRKANTDLTPIMLAARPGLDDISRRQTRTVFSGDNRSPLPPESTAADGASPSELLSQAMELISSLNKLGLGFKFGIVQAEHKPGE